MQCVRGNPSSPTEVETSPPIQYREPEKVDAIIEKLRISTLLKGIPKDPQQPSLLNRRISPPLSTENLNQPTNDIRLSPHPANDLNENGFSFSKLYYSIINLIRTLVKNILFLWNTFWH